MEQGSLTVQDCIDMYEKKKMETVIRHGKVAGFARREGGTYGFPVKVGHAHEDNPS